MNKLWLLLAFFLANPAFAENFVLENVLLPDFEQRQLLPVSVEVENGVIKQVVAASQELIHEDIRDGQRQVIMPAFIDMHSHSMGNSSLDRSDYQYIGLRGTANAMLYAGVHGWLDLYSVEDDILGYRNARHHEARNEAQVFAAGPCFTVPTGHCDFGDTRLISTADEAVAELRDLSQYEPDVAKIVYDTAGRAPTVDIATLTAFLNEAKSLGIKSVVHIGSWDDLRTATRLGANAVTHLPWEPMPNDIPALMQAQETAFIPTVSVINEALLLHEPTPEELAGSVLETPMTEALVKQKLLDDYPVTTEHPRMYEWLAGLNDDDVLRNRREAITKLHASGVNILVGSDAGNLAVYQGIGFHREMYFLQAQGMPPWNILHAGTLGAYKFLELEWGITAGQPAHFTLQNPAIFEDVRHSSEVDTIYLHGREVEREPLLNFANPGFFQYMKLLFGIEL